MPGDENHYQDEILVFDIETRSQVRLDLDKWPDQSLGGVYFNQGGIFTSDKSDYLWILRRNRTWDEVEDRKSTRLNSSHVAISYAVFCLKKKKNKNNESNSYQSLT